MRTTITFDRDTAAAIEQLRREQGMGVSEVANELIRRGLLRGRHPEPFVQRTHPLGIRIDASNVADAIETLEGPYAP